jgi:hypothetical protein
VPGGVKCGTARRNKERTGALMPASPVRPARRARLGGHDALRRSTGLPKSRFRTVP